MRQSIQCHVIWWPKYRSMLRTNVLLNTVYKCNEFDPWSLQYKTVMYVIRDIVAQSPNVYTFSANLQSDSTSLEDSAFMAICRWVNWSTVRSSIKLWDNFGPILNKLDFPNRFSKKSPKCAFTEIREMGTTLKKRQTNKYNKANSRFSQLYKNILSAFIR